MKLHRSTPLAAAIILLAALATFAQDTGYWYPESQTANTITGPVEIKATHITIALMKIPIAQVRALTPAEATAVFDADTTIPGGGALYRVKVPGDMRFLNKNSLCGHDDTEWMATWATRKTLEIAFFSGERPPVLTFEALNNSTDRCGTYTYSR